MIERSQKLIHSCARHIIPTAPFVSAPFCVLRSLNFNFYTSPKSPLPVLPFLYFFANFLSLSLFFPFCPVLRGDPRPSLFLPVLPSLCPPLCHHLKEYVPFHSAPQIPTSLLVSFVVCQPNQMQTEKSKTCRSIEQSTFKHSKTMRSSLKNKSRNQEPTSSSLPSTSERSSPPPPVLT